MTEQAVALRPEKAGEIMEAVIARGDLSKLDAAERAKYYTRVCESMGLNPLTKPFDYITLNGKLTLYALKTATDQLRKIYGVSVVDMTEKREGDLIVVTVKVQDATGRTDMSKGALTLKGLQGEALANGIMKAETKAKRRATLSICGLGFLDETEVETIPQARVLKKDHRADYHAMQYELDGCEGTDALDSWFIGNRERIAQLPPDWQTQVNILCTEKADDMRHGFRVRNCGEILSDPGPRQPEPPAEVVWDDDTPPEWDSDWEKLGPVKQAGTLCGDKSFWKFLAVGNKDNAAQIVRDRCRIKSRAELATDVSAQKIWRQIVADYRAWQREPAIVDQPSPRQPSARAADQGAPAEAVPNGAAGAPEVPTSLEDEARREAKRGSAMFDTFWQNLDKDERLQLKPIGPELRKLMDEAGA